MTLVTHATTQMFTWSRIGQSEISRKRFIFLNGFGQSPTKIIYYHFTTGYETKEPTAFAQINHHRHYCVMLEGRGNQKIKWKVNL